MAIFVLIVHSQKFLNTNFNTYMTIFCACAFKFGVGFPPNKLGMHLAPRGPFLKSHGNFMGPKSNIQIKI